MATIDAIDLALREIGHQTDRIGNGRQLVDRLAAGDRWDLVFNIAEGLHGTAREAQVPAILDLYEIPYTFSDPLVLAVCLHKGLTKTVVGRAGVPTTPFVLVQKIEDVETIDLPFPLFAKPVAEGTGKGITADSKIKDRDSLRRVCQELLARCRQPVLVETFLPGREFTVGILGTGDEARVIGSMEITLLPAAEAEVYSYVNKSRYEEFCRYLSNLGLLALYWLDSRIAIAAKSPSEAIAKPASMMSTPRSSSACAMVSFSCVVIEQPGDCSPSRSVVSKKNT